MKKIALAMFTFGLSLSAIAAPLTAQSPQKDQLGYSYGYVMGRTNTDTLKDLNIETFVQGLKDGAAATPSRLGDEQMARVLGQYKKQIESKQMLEFQQLANDNLKKGQTFLAENAKKSGVVTTRSGLQYQVLNAGTGATPKATSKVKVNYEGRLLDGTVFDSSIARNHPVEFQLSQVIQGWTEGLQTMKEGGKTRFFVPANLAYGQVGSGDAIEPNSVLIFDIELLQVLPQS